MEEFRRALIFWVPAVALVVLGAAALAAPAHEALFDSGLLEKPANEFEYDKGFLKVFRRLLLIPLVVLFLVRIKPWRDGGLRAFGLVGPTARVGSGVLAAGITLLVAAAVIAFQFAMGWMHWEDPPRWGTFGERVLRMVPAGVLIAVLEEFFFRGWLIRRFRQDVSMPVAATVSALVYGLVHAFKPTVMTVDVSHDFTGALEALGGWLAFMVDVQAFGPALVGLFLFGLLLTAAYQRTGTLWTGIGIHAAAVWVLFTYGALTERDPQRNWAGTKWLYDGPVLWAVLVGLAFVLWPRGATAGRAQGPSLHDPT